MTVALNPPTHHTYRWGAVKPWVAAAGNILGPLFNINSIGGVRQDPLPDHPSGHALDFMITQPGTQAGYAQGDALANFAVQHYQELGIKYIIWNKRYWDPQQGWIPYTAPSQIAYNPHTNHVHITFEDQPGSWTTSGSNVPGQIILTSAGGSGAGAPGSTGDPNAGGNNDLCAWNLDFGVTSTCVFSKVFVREVSGWGLYIIGGFTFAFGIVMIAAFTFGKPGAQGIINTAGLGKLTSKIASSVA